jgi:MFS-type transporter involved in bile tolerance (Atg22 family)
MAGLLGTRLAKDLLGPSETTDAGQAGSRALAGVARELREVFAGLIDGLKHLNEKRKAAYALGAVAVHRALYGTLLVQALLLYRNYFYSGGNGNKALGSVTLLVITSAVGYGLAAVLTPQGVKRLTKDQWIALWLLIGGVVTIIIGPTFDKYTFLVLGFALGLSAQCVKICVDTTVQQTVDDAYMGRVFSLYDMLFNVAYVIGPAIAIPFLPETGKSYLVILVVGACYVAAGALYAALTVRGQKGEPQSPPARPTQAVPR